MLKWSQRENSALFWIRVKTSWDNYQVVSRDDVSRSPLEWCDAIAIPLTSWNFIVHCLNWYYRCNISGVKARTRECQIIKFKPLDEHDHNPLARIKLIINIFCACPILWVVCSRQHSGHLTSSLNAIIRKKKKNKPHVLQSKYVSQHTRRNTFFFLSSLSHWSFDVTMTTFEMTISWE